MMLKRLLRYRNAPDEISLDDFRSALLHREIIKSKPLLKQFYDTTYGFISREAETCPRGAIVELGSGGGYIKEFLPEAITSDIMEIPGVDMAFSALDMPFEAGSLAALCMIDSLHHFQDCSGFFREAARVLKPGGKVIMLEPANTLFGRFIYRNFHHEPFEPSAAEWSLPRGGPMSVANGALPWIVFVRDADRFRSLFPALEITRLDYCHPFLYLLSGGVSMRQLVPGVMLPVVCGAESVMAPVARYLGMFMRVVLTKATDEPDRADTVAGDRMCREAKQS